MVGGLVVTCDLMVMPRPLANGRGPPTHTMPRRQQGAAAASLCCVTSPAQSHRCVDPSIIRSRTIIQSGKLPLLTACPHRHASVNEPAMDGPVGRPVPRRDLTDRLPQQVRLNDLVDVDLFCAHCHILAYGRMRSKV